MLYKVFIQNEAGSNIKNRHNEKTLEHLGAIELDKLYPFPYGFILDTTTEDGDAVDCFVITQKILKSNSIVECSLIGLLEIFENDEIDHKIIAQLPDEPFKDIGSSIDSIRKFYEDETNYFKVGEFLPVAAAKEFIKKSSISRGLTP